MPQLSPHFCPVIQIQAVDLERKEDLVWGYTQWECTENSSGNTPSPSSCYFWPSAVTTSLTEPSRCCDKVCHKYGLHIKLEDYICVRFNRVWCQCAPSVHTKTQLSVPSSTRKKRGQKGWLIFQFSIYRCVCLLEVGFLMPWSQQTTSTTTKPHNIPTHSRGKTLSVSEFLDFWCELPLNPFTVLALSGSNISELDNSCFTRSMPCVIVIIKHVGFGKLMQELVVKYSDSFWAK